MEDRHVVGSGGSTRTDTGSGSLRAEARARIGHGRDRLENAGAEFHAAVEQGFRDLAAADSERWVVVDGGGTVAEVAERVLAVATARLGSP